MAKLERLTNKIFGASASSLGDNPEIGQFGSALNGSYVGTGDVSEIQSLEAWSNGWVGAVTPDEQFPTLPEMTGVHKVLSHQTGYLLQEGIAEYDTNTTYYKGSLVKTYDTELKLFVSIVDNNQSNSLTDRTKWNEVPLTGTYHPPLLSIQWSDHLINDIQWLRGDTFSWQSGDVYTRVYNELVSQYNNEASEQEQLGNITFKRTPNGYKIATAEYENAINGLYNTNGIAWYYILDTTNKRFKLPRTKFGFEGLRNNVGDNIAESLPNITGEGILGISSSAPNGAFSSSTYQGLSAYAAQNTPLYYLKLNAYSSSSTYQDNAPVQERATQMYLYFYVGEYSQSAIEQTAGISAELFNGKADINLNNVSNNIHFIINTYENGTSGYRIWNDGYCEQWGITNAGSQTTITLTKTMLNTNYQISVTEKRSSGYGNGQQNCAGSPISGNQLYLISGISGSGVNVYWKVSGYLAEGEY